MLHKSISKFSICQCFFFVFFFLFFFGSGLLCSRDTPYVTHQVLKGQQRGACPRQALIKLDPIYQSHILSPLSPPLSGGSSKGQAIPACFRCNANVFVLKLQPFAYSGYVPGCLPTKDGYAQQSYCSTFGQNMIILHN